MLLGEIPVLRLIITQEEHSHNSEVPVLDMLMVVCLLISLESNLSGIPGL